MDWAPIVRFALRALSLLAVSAIVQAHHVAPAEEPVSTGKASHVLFVTGDDEYGSELSMPMIAEILTQRHGMKATVLFAENQQGQRDRHGHRIPGLQALRSADAAVFFMRFRALPDDQLREIVDYAQSGKPMLGLRTATHALQYPEPPNNKWNDAFGREYFGQKWIDHYGHGNSSQISVLRAAADDPILRGVAPTFWAHSWLYVMNRGADQLPADCRFLLFGRAIRGAVPGGEVYGDEQKVAWTRELPTASGVRQRIFYTSLGHPKDFEDASVRRMLVNAIYWALDRAAEIPPAGANVDLLDAYNPPDPH